MSDLMNAIIAAKLMGNGGGGGGGSGLPPITTEPAEVFSDTVAFEGKDGIYQGAAMSDLAYVVGEQYTIEWDSTSYICTAFDVGGQVAVGNMGIMGGPDTGEPFLSAAMPDMSMVMFITANASASHDITISAPVQSPPNGTALIVSGGEWTMQNGYGYTKHIDGFYSDPALSVTIQPHTGGGYEFIIPEADAVAMGEQIYLLWANGQFDSGDDVRITINGEIINGYATISEISGNGNIAVYGEGAIPLISLSWGGK